MRFTAGTSTAMSVLAALAILAVSGSASAGRLKERIYGDTFGNLVVYSPAGYKQIVVGRGYLADELAAAEPAPEPPAASRDRKRHFGHCYYKPMFWRGRDRMYGLPDGVVPAPPRICH